MWLLLLLQVDTIDDATRAGQGAYETSIQMVSALWRHLPFVAVGIVVFIVFYGLAYLVRKLTRVSMEKAGFDPMVSSLVARIGFYAVAISGLFVAAVVIFPGLTPGDLITGLGIGSVALGFALKDVLQNLFAGFLILLYRPFKIGDQIRIGDYEGRVEEITVRATNVRTLDGERVVIPNTELYMKAVLVRTAFPDRRTNFVIGIGYEDDIEEARNTILKIVEGNDEVLNSPAPFVDVVDLGDSAVNLKVDYWTSSSQPIVRIVRDKLITSIKYALDEKGIDMPYPHRMLYLKNTSADGVAQ
ncbi:MAG: mechanosensitive ion channel [Pyrinomonadaceae bacterium]